MGNCCCKHKSSCDLQTDEVKGLLDESKKGSGTLSKGSEDESGRTQADFQEKDGGEAASHSAHESSRKAGSDAQFDTGVTAVHVKQEVRSEVRKAEDGCPEDPSSKAEEGHAADHARKSKEGNVEDEKSENGHLGYPVHKKYMLIKDPPKVEDLQVESPSRQVESGPSPKLEGGVVSSLKNEPMEVEDPFFKSEPIESVDPSFKNEPIEVEDHFFKSESVEVGDPYFKNEPVEVEEPAFQSESAEVEDIFFMSESVEVADISFKSESVEDEEPAFQSESAEVAAISLKSRPAQLEEPLSETQDIKAEDQTLSAVDGPTEGPSLTSHLDISLLRQERQTDRGPTAVVLDEAFPQTAHNALRGNLSSPERGEDAESASGTLRPNGKLERNDRGSEGDAPEAVREAKDLNDDSVHSAAQAKTSTLTDELVTTKSGAAEGEKAEEPGARIVRLSEVPSLDDIVQDADEREAGNDEGEEDRTGEGEGEGDASKATEASGEGEATEQNVPTESRTQGECANRGSPMIVEVKMEPVECEAGIAREEQANSDEDLYRGAEEIAMERGGRGEAEPLIQVTLPGLRDRSSVAPGVDILSYSQREWKGNTAKSALIRKGYAELSCSFGNLRLVRGDNYCALRATLFQVLCESDKLPAWMQDDDIALLPEKLVSEMEQIEKWRFPLGHNEGAVEQLKHHLELLRRRWQAAAQAGSAEERRRLCEPIFQDGEEEHALLEALKFLMLSAAVELHGRMQRGLDDVPVFCWLLFARDSSDCPAAFLANHLSHVGFGGGLEQVEMFLLGYALQLTIQVYRLYKADTEEFITYYPDDHKEDWPHVCLVTEDDRHYNVPVGKLKGLQLPEATNVG